LPEESACAFNSANKAQEIRVRLRKKEAGIRPWSGYRELNWHCRSDLLTKEQLRGESGQFRVLWRVVDSC